MVEQPIKKAQVRCQIGYVNQCLFHYWNQDNSENIIPQNALLIVSFSFLCQSHSLIFGHRCETFHVSWLHIPLHLFNIGYNSTMWTSSSCSVHQTGRWIFVIRHREVGSESPCRAELPSADLHSLFFQIYPRWRFFINIFYLISSHRLK